MRRSFKIFYEKISRTFLAWLHVVVMLAGASVTIVTFASGQGIVEQLFGIILLPVSIAYIFYALSQCKSFMLNFEEMLYCELLTQIDAYVPLLCLRLLSFIRSEEGCDDQAS